MAARVEAVNRERKIIILATRRGKGQGSCRPRKTIVKKNLTKWNSSFASKDVERKVQLGGR